MTAKPFVGVWHLVRFILRRDRVRLAIWVLSLCSLFAYGALSIKQLYPDGRGLAEYAATVKANQALIALSGPAQAIDTMGGRIAWESWIYAVAIALMAMLLVNRHTRADEEQGRTELVRSTIVGRHAHSAAAFLVASAACLVIGAGVTISFIALDLPVEGSVVLGAAFALFGMVFAAIALVAAQLTEHARTAMGIAGAALGASYVLRAVGDIGPGALSWLSPMGWLQGTRPYAGERWWPLVLSLVVALGLVVLGLWVESIRDFGAAIIAPRPGPPSAAPSLTRPLGLAWRLQRGSVFGWSLGSALGGVAFGSVVESVNDLVGDNQAILDYLNQIGGASLADIFLATILTYFGLVAAGFGVVAALRLRSEETAGRAEVVLAASVSRRQWTASHLAVALGGSAIVLLAGGAATGLAYAATSADWVELPRVTAASLAFVPGAWVLVGLAFALFGVLPRAIPAVWAALGFCIAVGVLGQALNLPRAVLNISPFQHVGQVPALAADPVVIVLTLAIAAGLLVVGLQAFRHRDLATT